MAKFLVREDAKLHETRQLPTTPGRPQRIMTRLFAFDCIKKCERHDPPCNGAAGRQHEQWLYAVKSEEELAVSITVNTSAHRRSAGSVEAPSVEAHGSDLSVHASFPIEEEHVRTRRAADPCDLIEGGCYVLDTSSLYAKEWFGKHGEPTFDQPEAFWRALEARLSDAQARYLPLKDQWTLCRGCDGRGLVPSASLSPGSLLRAELIGLLEGELDLPKLRRIEQVASAGQQLLRALSADGVGAALRGGFLPGAIFPPVELPMAESTPGETYGASVLRELVPLGRAYLAQMKKLSPERLVTAIAEAREQGLDDIEARLREELESLLSLSNEDHQQEA